MIVDGVKAYFLQLSTLHYEIGLFWLITATMLVKYNH